MKKNELIKLEICYKAETDFDIARQTVFFSKEELENKNAIPIKIRNQKIESMSLKLENK